MPAGLVAKAEGTLVAGRASQHLLSDGQCPIDLTSLEILVAPFAKDAQGPGPRLGAPPWLRPRLGTGSLDVSTPLGGQPAPARAAGFSEDLLGPASQLGGATGIRHVTTHGEDPLGLTHGHSVAFRLQGPPGLEERHLKLTDERLGLEGVSFFGPSEQCPTGATAQRRFGVGQELAATGGIGPQAKSLAEDVACFGVGARCEELASSRDEHLSLLLAQLAPRPCPATLVARWRGAVGASWRRHRQGYGHSEERHETDSR